MMELNKVMALAALTSLVTLVLGLFTSVHAIDCYKCMSMNGMSEECEDKFDRGIKTVHLISRECEYGYFKGTHCIKLRGEREDGTRITLRDCSDNDWGSHCGQIRYLSGDEEQMINGCLEACDHDGCNSASAHAPSVITVLLVLTVVAILTCLTQDTSRGTSGS